MTTVLVTDGEQRAALAVVRSLGRAGHHVGVCAHSHAPLAAASRHCRARHAVPDPLAEPDRFAEQMERVVADSGADVVIPITEAALAALLPIRDRLGARLPFPTQRAFEQVCDKQLVIERAVSLGIDVPGQLVAGSPADLQPSLLQRLRFPLVIKPARSIVAAGPGRAKTAVMHAADAAAFNRIAEALPAAAFPLLLQERIVGPGAGVFMLVWRGDVVASFSHRRLREKPPSGGVSVLSESRPVDPALFERSRALLRSFDWEGVAMVEYKMDRQTGRYHLMEVNGRFWGSLQLAIDAGVDFPALLVELAQGRQPEPTGEFRHGVRSRWFLGDVDQLVTRLRRTPEELALPAGSSGRIRAVREFIAAFGPGSRNEILRWSDPLPAAREAAGWLRQLLPAAGNGSG